MTSEERKIMYDDLHSGVRMMMDKISSVAKEKSSWTLCEMGQLADIMKDLAMTEKGIAKAHYMYSEKSDESY